VDPGAGARRDAELVRATWAKVAPHRRMAAAVFYARLFRLAPEARSLFRDDMEAQAAKLADTIAFVVDHIDDEAVLVPAARDLARRHVDYHVTAEQYDQVGEALLWTLRELLGPAFGPEEEGAWARAYAAIASVMVAEAYGHSPK
jgi:nitric oxide dioxygenase